MALTKFKFIKIKLDRADMTIAQQITAKVGAVNGNGIELQLVNGSIIENTTGVAVYLNWKHQTVGNQGSEPFTLVDATNGIYRVSYPTELLSGGLVDADIIIVDGTSITMTTQPILIKVAAAATSSTVQSANAWNDIQTLLVAKIVHEARMDAIESNADTKAPLESPALTGTPTALTPAAGTNTTQLATTAFVKGEVAALVESSPATLDTLNELAAALGDDPNFATTMATELGLKAPKASPDFTGTPTTPTAPVNTNNGQIASTAFVKAQIANDVVSEFARFKNWIINGMFDVWQRGVSQTISGYGSDDRWQNGHSVSTKTHLQQVFSAGQTDVPNNPTFFSRTIITSALTTGCYVYKGHKVEDIRKLSGKTISVSFWAKADTPKQIAVNLTQNFGSGGSPDVFVGAIKFSLTTSWQRFTRILTIPSVSGKAIGVNNYTELQFWLEAGSGLNSFTDSLGNQSGTFDIANVSLVEGSVAVECQNQPYADVLRECQRYYQRFGGNVAYATIGFGFAESTTIGKILLNHAVPLRANAINVEFSTLHWVSPANGASVSNVSILTDAVTTLNTNIMITSTGLTANHPIILRQYNNVSGYLALSAEL